MLTKYIIAIKIVLLKNHPRCYEYETCVQEVNTYQALIITGTESSIFLYIIWQTIIIIILLIGHKEKWH